MSGGAGNPDPKVTVMAVTRFSDVVVPGGRPPAPNPDAVPDTPLSPFEAEHAPPSHNDLLRDALAIQSRLADDRGQA